jgi:hypothetical protein
MTDGISSSKQTGELAGFGIKDGETRAQSTSANTRAARGDGLSLWANPLQESQTLGTNPSVTQTSPQLVGRSVNLYPTLLEIIKQYEDGSVSYVKTHRKGESYLNGLGELTDLKQDTLSLKFTEALNWSNWRREELREGEGERRRGNVGEEVEIGGLDWGEDGGREGEVRLGRRGGNIREDQCPWYRKGEQNSNAPRESQKKTREIIQYLRDNVSTAMQWVWHAEGSPKHFPDSEWANIIRGKSVDLRKVLASLFLSRPVPENVGSMGGIEVRFPGREKSRRVENSSDWHLAWHTAAEATAVVFPHREKELAKYSAFMFQKFTQQNPIYHAQVIIYDDATWESVGGGESRSLLDTKIHAEFNEAILHPNGVEYPVNGSHGGCRGQLCNWFNGKLGCENSNCAYEHKCRACKDLDHGQASCPKSGVEGKGTKAKIS